MVNTTNSQSKYKLSVILLLSSLVVIIFCLYYLNGLVVRLKGTRVTIAETKRDIALLDKAIKDRDQYGNDINLIKSTLPSKYFEVAFFTSQIESLATNNNLTLKTKIDEKAVVEKGTYSSISYTLTLNGSFSSISTFLSQITKLPYHTAIDKLEMSVGSGGPVCIIKMSLFVEK